MTAVNGFSVSLNVRLTDMELGIVVNSHPVEPGKRNEPYLHTHPYFELVSSVDTPFNIIFANNYDISMKPSTACMTPPGVYHCAYSAEYPKKLVYLRFSCTRSGEARKEEEPLYETFQAALEKLTAPIIFRDESDVPVLLRKIYEELTANSIAGKTQLTLLIQQLVINVLRAITDFPTPETVTSPPLSTERNSRYSYIEEWIDKNYNKQVKSDDLAKELGLSERQLSRTMHEIFGIGFREKLTDRRLQTSLRMLANTNTPVEQIAYKVGYTSFAGYHLAFVKRFGMTPGEYRKTHE